MVTQRGAVQNQGKPADVILEHSLIYIPNLTLLGLFFLVEVEHLVGGRIGWDGVK